MPTKDEIKRRRDSALSIELGIDTGDKIIEMISRRDGLYAVSLDKIIRVNLPNDLDPTMQHEDAPVAQTLVINKGSRNPIVARTILQARDFSNLPIDQKQRDRLQDIAWEAMFSLLAMDQILSGLRTSIAAKQSEIAASHPKYVLGSSPPPPPIVEGLEIDFRSAVLIANHALNSISELFPTFFDMKFKRGAFDQIIAWSAQTFVKEDVLTKMLEGDHRWINAWGEVRNAIEHPRDEYYVKINNFRLLPSREIQLPTWQLKHSKLDFFRPQNLLEQLDIHQANILGLFENLLVVLVDKSIKLPVPIALIDKDEKDRNPECPKRYELQLMLPAALGKS